MKQNPKVTLFMATSADGIIATMDDKVSWSPLIREAYFEFVRLAGTLVVGRRTYDLMEAEEEISKLESVKIAVLTKTPQSPKGNVRFFSEPYPIIEHFLA